MLRGNNQLLEAARNEPSGGPGWREGLAMLSQFGRSLFDALVALEFSREGQPSRWYAQQLEPALGSWPSIFTRLSARSQRIHEWRFMFRRREMNLEEDIAQLEARMAAVRPRASAFRRLRFCAPMPCNCI
jgi:hypothetical protein